MYPEREREGERVCLDTHVSRERVYLDIHVSRERMYLDTHVSGESDESKVVDDDESLEVEGRSVRHDARRDEDKRKIGEHDEQHRLGPLQQETVLRPRI